MNQTIAKNNPIITLIVPFLLTTLTALGMEPADCPQLQLSESASAPKPTIFADLYIHPREDAFYTGRSLKQKIEDAGIKPNGSIPQNMPLIPVLMMVDKKNGTFGEPWKEVIPDAIWEYEKKQIKATGKKITKEDWKIINTKKFFDALPADLIYDHNTGSVWHFTFHGYPVVATCCEFPNLTQSFNEQLIEKIENFKLRPSFSSTLFDYSTDQQELIVAKVISKKLNGHGKNGFVSIENLPYEDERSDEQSSEDSSNNEQNQPPCTIQ